MTDEERLSKGLVDDLDGHFEELVRTFQNRLYGFTLRLTGSPQDAEESTQDAFVRAYRALENYSGQRRSELRLRPWLYQIALNVVRNRVRRRTVPQVVTDEHLANTLTSPLDERPEEVALAAERQERLAQAVLKLPERFAVAVTLRHVQGLSYAETAEVLEVPIGTVKSDVHRGLRLLRVALEPELLLEAARSK